MTKFHNIHHELKSNNKTKSQLNEMLKIHGEKIKHEAKNYHSIKRKNYEDLENKKPI